MADAAICDWLMDNADAPVRYRTARELLGDLKTTKKIEDELLLHPAAGLWLRNLKPQTPPQQRWMEHGSFDFCLENAILKLVQLGLHGSLQHVADAAGYYLAKMKSAATLTPKRKDFITAILTANLLSLAGVEGNAVQAYMLGSLDELYAFTAQQSVDIYLSDTERGKLTGIPPCWKDTKPVIKPMLIQKCGFAFPLLYDIIGLHSLYRLKDANIDRKIDAVIRFIATDAFHRAIDDGYGIIVAGKRSYMAMGWDPKFPGWFDVAGYMQSGFVPQLLFIALHLSRYPAARETPWFSALLENLEAFQTDGGRTVFPAEWLPEQQGYAVMGRHLSFGENRRKRNWREIESTFYMQLLRQNPA